HVAITANTVDSGSGIQVITVRDAETGAVKFQVTPYESGFRGGVNVAVGDVNFDGIPDLISVAGANHAPLVQIYSGTPNATGNYSHVQLANFAAFNVAFRSGASLAVGDVNHDGANDLVVAAGRGWLPQVKVFNGKTLLTSRAVLRPSFNAFETTFRGGVNVAVGDLNKDGFADIVTTRASNGRSTVNVYSGSTFRLLKTFLGYGPVFHGGLSVAVGDYNGDAVNDIVVGTGVGTSPKGFVYNGATLFTLVTPATLATFAPGTPAMGKGVRVKAYVVNGGDPGTIERVFLVEELVGANLAEQRSWSKTDVLP